MEVCKITSALRYYVEFLLELAFGAFARLVPDLAFMAKHLELADSITSDGMFYLELSTQ
jgi:hypothetical protein